MTNEFVVQIYKNRANIFSAKNHNINELLFLSLISKICKL
jgi:hypothetical protein